MVERYVFTPLVRSRNHFGLNYQGYEPIIHITGLSCVPNPENGVKVKLLAELRFLDFIAALPFSPTHPVTCTANKVVRKSIL
jgi:hypothetical protein